MEKQGEAWKSLMLSPGGKETLLKAVFQVFPSFIMCLFLLPRSITTRMDAMLKRFFWSGSVSKRSIHWRAGRVLYAHKSEGGLGFRPFHIFNLALLAKQAWRILTNPDALWVRVLKALYFPRVDFTKAKKWSKASWIWSGIWEARKWMEKGIIKVIGSGRDTRLLHDPWLFVRPSPLGQNITTDSSVVADFIDPISREWRFDILEDFLSTAEIQDVAGSPIGPCSMKDYWAWRYTGQGNFIVKSAFHHFHHQVRRDRGEELTIPDSNKDRWKWLWGLSLPLKLKFFVWRASRGALATRHNLHARRCSPTSVCPVCDVLTENIHHCLFLCPHAANGWNLLYPELATPPPLTNVMEWLFSLSSTLSTDLIHNFIYLLWQTWKTRNENVFRDKALRPFAIVARAKEEAHRWRACPKKRTSSSHPQPAPPPDTPLPPPSTHAFEIHYDGSFFHDSQEPAYGVIITNDHGQVVDGKVEPMHCFSPIEAEVKALLKGALVAVDLHAPCLVRSDCLTLVKAIQVQSCLWSWRAAAWLGRILQIASDHPDIRFEWINRKLKSKADWVARSCARNQLSSEWIQIHDVSPLL
ncbi:unnamed protein product [Linum trigynum]|uniref:Reverse transcriptase zinc-binding domain-containing protein n=1 Tax=Linum trigynum TaxID=586398 RepID=A0AAV2CFN8_9ROSI